MNIEKALTQTITVGQLVEALKHLPRETKILCWLPGSRITLHGILQESGKAHVLIEGTLVEGSALG